MTTPIDTTNQVIDAASRALTLIERIAARFGRGDPRKRATWLRLRAIDKRNKAAKARLDRRRLNLLADAVADDAAANVLDPPTPATCAD